MTITCGTAATSSRRSLSFRDYTAMNRAPWHSIRQAIYHNEAACTVGKNIQIKNLRDGTGEKPLCPECADLARRG